MIHGDVLGERARLSPQDTALVEVASGARFTYAELNARAEACAAAWLGELDLAPGDRVAVLSGNRVELLDTFFAAGKSGVMLVPLNTRLTPHELAGIVADSGARVLMYAGDHAEKFRALSELVELECRVAFDAAADGEHAYRELVARASWHDLAVTRPKPEDPYCLLYTSGTTGKPKGVITPHRMVAWNACNTVLSWQLRSDDVSPIFTPVYHAGGLGAFLTPILAAGGTIVLHAGFDAAEIWRTIETERCTVVLGVPTIWKLLAEAPEFATVDLGHVRWFISGGAPLPRSVIDIYRERGIVLRQGYGLTEVGVNCFAMSSEEAWAKAGAIGRPLMFTEARVVGEDGAEMTVGEVGELCFRGPHVSSGYWNNDEATTASRDADGWFHTGDMARVDEDGFFYIAGRGKDMFISGGVNVYPAEIENELLQHPGLQDVAVVGVPHPKWGEVGVVFFVPTPGGEAVGGEELQELLEGRLARFKIPRRFIALDALPRTDYGKVIKADLVKLWEEEYGGG